MLKRFYLFTIALLLVSFTSNDANKKTALSANSIQFYGINFSKLKCIHRADFVDKIGNTQCESLLAKYFTEWNEYFITEKAKFDPKKYFQVATANIDLQKSIADVPNYNESDCIVEDDNYTIPADTIKSIVKKYKSDTQKGVGIVLIGESLNKAKGVGRFYVNYFDLSTGELLYSNRISGTPVGYGFGVYWINSMHEALEINIATIKRDRKLLGVIPK